MNKPQTQRRVDAVIFDVDGVLVSTDELHYLSWKRVADEEGIPFDRRMNRECLGRSRKESLEVVLRGAPRAYDERQKAELAERKNRYFLQLVERLGPRDAAPGCHGLLLELRRRGVKLAAASGSRNAPHILRRLELDGLFDVCISGRDISRSKPHPEVFLLAARRLGLPPGRCLVVEDAPAGVEAARRAGMRVVGVGPSPLQGAEHTVPSLAAVSADELLGG